VKSLRLGPAAFCCLLFGLVQLTQGQTGNLRFPESRSFSPGKLWLEWKQAERTGFVRGFIVGHGNGYDSGCITASSDSKDSCPEADSVTCVQKQHLFRKDVPFYEKFVTDFYSRYPEDRDVPMRILILQADDKSPDEVHQWLAEKSE
jgi:hypothetical protein